MRQLTMEELRRAVELLDIIVRPGDHEFWHAIEEAQRLLGYDLPRIAKIRAKKGLWERNPPAKTK